LQAFNEFQGKRSGLTPLITNIRRAKMAITRPKSVDSKMWEKVKEMEKKIKELEEKMDQIEQRMRPAQPKF